MNLANKILDRATRREADGAVGYGSTASRPTRKTLAAFVVLMVSPFVAIAASKGPETVVKTKELSMVRVNVTGQPYDYVRPWQKKAPFSKRALGAVLPQGRVLVTADLVANQNYVELERAESGDKIAANVVVVDYESNLALLEPADKKFLDGLTPLQLALDTVVGDRLAALQLESTGALVLTEGLVTTIQMTRYPADIGQFLTYRISMSLQYRDNSYTVPLVKNNKLAALLLRYDQRTQVVDAIPAPIIAHFLKDAESQHYRGFVSAGFGFFPTRDPQLRKFAEETGKPAGVYVTSVDPDSPAAKAGLQVGDIVVGIGNNEIDQNGNYVDPLYGKIEFTTLITAKAFAGDTMVVHIQRAGKPMQLNIGLEHRDVDDYVIPPYSLDRAPLYYVLGGLIFEELSRQYLREWGANWMKDAPQRLVYKDRFQSELYPEGNRRVVVLTQVLPANTTIGYDEVAYLTVRKVNGKDVTSLAELAEVVKQPVDGFITIETEEDPKQIALEAKQVDAEADALKQNYGLPALQRLE